MPNPDAFLTDLEALINRHSLENESDTPDFLLAAYLQRCLTLFGDVVRMRDTWYGQARHGQMAAVEPIKTESPPSEASQHLYDRALQLAWRVVYHWHEFGPTHGFEEAIHLLAVELRTKHAENTPPEGP